MGWYSENVRKLAPGAQVWAGENGPAAGGDDGTCGKNSVCGTYASAMWYADELGLRSRHGFAQHQRQDLIGGHYGLVDSPDSRRALSATQPLVLRPDFWINFMWKRTVGTNVLNITMPSKMVRHMHSQAIRLLTFLLPNALKKLTGYSCCSSTFETSKLWKCDCLHLARSFTQHGH